MIKTKMLAVLMVSLMMAVSVVPILGEDDEVSAAVGDGGYYSYTLNYDYTKMTEVQTDDSALSVAGMDAIYHPTYDGTTTTGYGSWTWNTETGIGPFNSFYAAFDMTDGNKMVAVLDPFDLTKKIDGTALDDMTKYNIMWVLPTVYWSVDGSGNLTLTNDPTSGGIAYAHTINGQTREYLAIGVYEGSVKNNGTNNILTSESNKSPTVSTSLSNFRTYAQNYTMDSSLNSSNGTEAYSMVWNYYQYRAYVLCSLIMMENFDSQRIVGNGVVPNWPTMTLLNTGLLNSNGPYYGNTDTITIFNNNTSEIQARSPVKLLLENVWGNCDELIDGLYWDSTNSTLYANSSDNPIETTDGDFVSQIGSNFSATTYNGNAITSIKTNGSAWGLGNTTTNGYTNKDYGLCDGVLFSGGSTAGNYFRVGGGAFQTECGGYQAGISAMQKVADLPSYSYCTTTRLAFVYGDVIATVTVQDDSSTYGTVSSNGFATSPGAIITIDGNTITCDENTVTATPISPTTTSIYSFDGWYNGSTLIPDGTLEVTGDMTITAHFSQAERLYDVTVTSSNTDYGTVSSALVQVPYNTTIASATNTITLGTTPDATVVTATPTTSDAQYTYAFSSWTGVPVGGYITEATSITANFTQTLNSYTITWVIGETSTTETYDYGEMPTHENPTPPEGYYFAGWNPQIATVTGDQTYTAVFSNMTVTFDAGKGTLDGESSKNVVAGQPIGELPECTPPTNYMFDGWYTAATGGTKVTEDTIVTQDASFTLYAHYELVPALQPVKAILDVMPILIAVGLILGAVYVFMTRPELATTNNLLYAIVGISVAVLMLAVIVIPIIGNAL